MLILRGQHNPLSLHPHFLLSFLSPILFVLFSSKYVAILFHGKEDCNVIMEKWRPSVTISFPSITSLLLISFLWVYLDFYASVMGSWTWHLEQELWWYGGFTCRNFLSCVSRQFPRDKPHYSWIKLLILSKQSCATRLVSSVLGFFSNQICRI